MRHLRYFLISLMFSLFFFTLVFGQGDINKEERLQVLENTIEALKQKFDAYRKILKSLDNNQKKLEQRILELESGKIVGQQRDSTPSTLLGSGREMRVKEPVGPSGSSDGNLLTELREDQSDWVINGNNYNLVDSQLSSQGLFTAYVGDSSWGNYVVEFDVKQVSRSRTGLHVLIRRQSDTDYVVLHLGRYMQNCSSKWLITKKGKGTEVVNSEMRYDGKPSDCGGHYRIEVDGKKYKIFRDGSQMFVFNNNTFANGGVGLKSLDDNVTFTIENFKVVNLR